MFNFFARSTPADAATAKPEELSVAATDSQPQNVEPTPVTEAKVEEAPEAQQNVASPTDPRWYTCMDFVRVDASADAHSSTASPTEMAPNDAAASNPATSDNNPPPPAAATTTPVVEDKEEIVKDDEYNDNEWQEVTMTAFRGDKAPENAKKDEGNASSSSSDSEEDAEAQQPAAAADVTTVGGLPPQQTILNLRAREQRSKEDQKKAELLALGRAAEEMRNLMAAKALLDAEDEHLQRANEEMHKLAADQARLLAESLDREEQARRKQPQPRLQQQQQPAAPAPAGGEASPKRLCDCLGASSGFHRQGCNLRK